MTIKTKLVKLKITTDLIDVSCKEIYFLSSNYLLSSLIKRFLHLLKKQLFFIRLTFLNL